MIAMTEYQESRAFDIWLRHRLDDVPSWLVSMIVHLALLVVLALVTLPSPRVDQAPNLLAEYESLEPNVTMFEPREALVSEMDGMAHTYSLLETAADSLASGGLIAIEVDSTRAAKVLDLACQLGWQNARIEADLFSRPRFLLANKEI